MRSDSAPVRIAYYLRDGMVCADANRSCAAGFGLDARIIVVRRLGELS